MSASNSGLTPRGAIAFGVLFMACGTYPVLAGLGMVPMNPTPGTPAWVVVATGGMFILAGLAIIVDYAMAGPLQADGSLPESAPLFLRVTQYVLGLAIVGLMFAVFAWIAFGPGQRQFSSSISLPFWSSSGRSSERSGRIAFGIGAGFMGLFLVLAAVSGAKRLWRGDRGGSEAK